MALFGGARAILSHAICLSLHPGVHLRRYNAFLGIHGSQIPVVVNSGDAATSTVQWQNQSDRSGKRNTDPRRGTDYVTVLDGAPEITCLSQHTGAIAWRYQNSQIFDNVLTQMGDYSLLSLLQSETQSAFWRAIGGECDVWSKSSSHWGAAKE